MADQPFPQPSPPDEPTDPSAGGGSDPIGAIEADISVIWNDLLAFIAQVEQWLSDFLQDIEQLAQAIWHVLEDIWNWLINTVIPFIMDRLYALYDILHNFLQPIINILNRIRTWYLTYIYPWVKLAQQIISELRIAVQLLKLLGVKWA